MSVSGFGFYPLILFHAPIIHARIILCPCCFLFISVSIAPEPKINWFRNDEEIQDCEDYQIVKEALGVSHLKLKCLKLIDQVCM